NLGNGALHNRTEPRLGQLEHSQPAEGTTRPAWVIAILASVLIFTTVVDVLGNLLVIISVFRNRKLRNAAGTDGFNLQKLTTLSRPPKDSYFPYRHMNRVHEC
uniref:Uncharacterized protein n=1 Tax=Fundulus heteroclitus TaxID=8078 RepID=A0A3Q2TKQ3_FUNHE